MKPEDWRQEGFIFPKTEEERCTDANCFSHIFKYLASRDQIEVRSPEDHSKTFFLNNGTVTILLLKNKRFSGAN